MAKVSATFEYSGMADYWGGNGRRWDRNAGCAFAYYGCDTTLADIIDQWVSDFNSGGDFDCWPETITADDVRAALLAMLSDQGRADYASGAIWDGAKDLEPVDEDNYDCESPVCIVLIQYDICPDCDAPSGENTVDELCDACNDYHYPEN